MGLFSKSKKIRSTYEAETLRKVFKDDYQLYSKVEHSDDLKRYNELCEYVNSPLFKNRRSQIEQLCYKNSEYYIAEHRYKKLLAKSELRAYYQIRGSQELQGYQKVRETDLHRQYAELKVVVKSDSFDRKLRPEEYLAYKKIIADPRIKALIHFEKNKKYRYYLEMKDSKFPEEFEQLAAYIKSDEFKKNREYLMNKKRYLTTDDYKLLCEYGTLKKQPDIVKYFSLREDMHFKNMCDWKLVFADDFNTGRLDENKWITRYYAGEKFLHDTYAIGGDVQLYMKENLSFNESAATLNFKKESIIGKYWDENLGLKEKKYEYTSALISTASSLRQCYGRFEAKIKMEHSPLKQSFWMRSTTDLPHIEIMSVVGNGLECGTICAQESGNVSTLQRLPDIKLSNDYYIFTLEWQRDKMVWSINDTIVREINQSIPDVPMYIIFSLGSTKAPTDKCIPAKMEIDWVRVYTKNDR